jgi:transposase
MSWDFGMAEEMAKTLEDRRRRGMRMLKRGVSQAEVARVLEVSRQTTSRWGKMLADDAGSWRAGQRGRPSGLTDRQLRRLDRLVRGRMPNEYGYLLYRWSVALVTDLVEREFGIRYSAANVRRVLRERGLFPGYGRPAMKRVPMHGWREHGKPVPSRR